MQVVNLGFDNVVAASRIVAVANASAAAMKRLRQEAAREKRLIDVTNGRRTRAIVITDSAHVILSSVQAQTLIQRLGAGGAALSSGARQRRSRNH
jgi:regulator of extracellular matrix RemA (YlzA/DUF370 family)